MSDLMRIACEAIDRHSEDLRTISQNLWNHPEEGHQEKYAHDVITDFLEIVELPVERSFVLATGFRSMFGSNDKGPHVALICEYDALPEIGHACGHNLIAEVGLAAGIGVKAAFEANGQPLGKVTILGTPAEETDGGKVDMIEAGVFKDVDVAMMAHPFPYNELNMNCLAMDSVTVVYHGKAAHAAAFPWEGVNALDAAVLCYQNVSCMRQQFKPTWRVHGVIHKGGTKPNIIPEMTELEYYARTSKYADLETLKTKLEACFKAAAASTGCSVDIKWSGRPMFDMKSNTVITDLFGKNATDIGIELDKYSQKVGNTSMGSTDMGNVSYVVPSIHPMFYIGSDAVNHTREFAEASGDVKAQRYTLDIGKAMASTALDIMTQKDILPKIKDEFMLKS